MNPLSELGLDPIAVVKMGDEKLCASNSFNNIQIFWDAFITAESKSYEKGVWFDTYLAEFLALVKEGTPVKNILSSNTCNSGSVSTLVACELLSDVHNLCNEPDDGEDLAALVQHLLTGRGWRCLAVLKCLGLQDVSCSRELSSLLISLYSVGGETPDLLDKGREGSNPYFPGELTSTDEEAICCPQPVQRKSRSFSNPDSAPPSLTRRASSFRVPRAVTAPEISKDDESSESDDPDSNEAHQVRSALKIRLNPMDFDYFTSVIRSDDEVNLESANYSPMKRKKTPTKLSPETFHDERLKSVFKQVINHFEFKMLVIELLQDLVKSEKICQQVSGSHQLVSLQTMNFSLETLCSLQFGSKLSKRVFRLKCHLSRLLLSSLDKVLIQPEVTFTALQKGVLPVMLRLSEDILRKHSLETVESLTDPEESRMLNEYIFGVIYGVISTVHCLLIQNSSPDKLDQFLSLFHQFGNSLNGRLIDKTVTVLLSFPLVDPKRCAERAKKIILLVSQLITTLKKTRTKITHARECKRNRHKQCLTKAAMHHHDNIFGCVFVGSPLPSSTQQNCSISFLFLTLTKFLSDKMDKDIALRTLQLMSACGTCCCFPALVLLKKIVRLILCTDQRIRHSGLVLLERTFYKQMGAFEESTSCELCARNQRVEGDLSSKCSSIDISSPPSTPTLENKSKWSCLSMFKDLLLSSDSKVVFIIGSHLLKVIPQCKLVVKQEILYSVFYPIFIESLEHFNEKHLEIDKFLILTCLSVFTHLLRRVRIIEQFLEQKAMTHIMDLLKDKDAMKLCCSILEIVIITQIWRAGHNNKKQHANRVFLKDTANVEEFDILLGEVQIASNKFLSLVHSEGSKEDLEKLTLAESIVSGNDLITFDSNQCYQSYTELLCCLIHLWKTLANLSLFSPEVRQSVQERTTTVLAHQLILTLLDRISKNVLIRGESLKDQEVCVNQLHLRLIEPLLVLCVLCPPAADNPETFVGCESLMQQLQPLLSLPVKRGTVTVRQVCDVLYRVSLAQPSSRLVMPTHNMPKVGSLSWEGSDIVSTLASAVNSVQFDETVSECESSPELTADEGYEADVEIRDHLSEQAEDVSADIGSFASSRKVSVDGRKLAPIVHSELCILALELVASFVQSEGLSEAQLLDCVYCVQKLSREDCRILVKHNMVSRLLSQFSHVLTVNDAKYTELQRAVLDLVSQLARHTVEPLELTQYLRLFTLDDPPLESLLPPLVSMVSNSQIEPSRAIKFPISCGERTSLTTQTSPAEKTAIMMRQQHIAADIQSSWSSCAMALPINTDLGWSMWVNGFSVSFWIQLQSSASPSPPSSPHTTHFCDDTSGPADYICSDTSLSDTWCTENGTLINSSESAARSQFPSKEAGIQPSLMHLISVGFDVMVLEIWLDVPTEKLVFRLVRPDGKRQELLCTASVKGHVTNNKWHNLAINVRDSVQKRKVVIEVMVYIDGCIMVQVPLVFTGLLIRKSRPSCLLLGHCGQSDSSFLISNVLMFRAPVFNKENSLRLFAYGPDFIHLTQADVGNAKPNLSTVFNVQAVKAGVNWESVHHEQSSHLRELQENVLLTYSAENYQTMNAYPQSISNSTGVVGSLFPPTPGFRIAAVDTRASQLLPMAIRPLFFAPIHDIQYHNLAIAADTIGGISVFLFLFARVVELKGSEESQAQALYILLRLAQNSCELNSQFETRNVAGLLCHVLASPRCTPSLHMLKMILDVCCDRAGLITVHTASGQGTVNTLVPALVTESALIARTVMLAWRQWARTPGTLLTLLTALQALLRDSHPHREFNAAQLNHAGLVHTLLHFCKEMFVSGEPCPPIDSTVCSTVVDLVRALMGAPPELSHIVLIYDYLVLAHPAHATYISSVRPSFYFLVNTNNSSYPSSNHSDIDPQVTNLRKSKSMFSSLNEVPDPTTKFHLTQPVDPTKLNKALANLQIKQLGQQQNMKIAASLDTNRSEIFTSSGQGSMDDGFSSDDKLNLSLSDMKQLESITAEALLLAVDDEKEKAEVKREEVNRLEEFKRGSLRRSEQPKMMDPATIITEGLLLLLRDVMLVLPDNMVHQVLSHVIKVEALLVMANHQSAEVRSAVVKVLSAYLQRASGEVVNNFVQMKGYYQLANQVGQYPATPDLVEGIVSMVTGLHWLPLEEQLGDEEAVQSDFTLAALPPLLALLPVCVHDIPLAHHLIHFLQRLFTKVALGQRALMDCGLIETLCKTLVAISHTNTQPTDILDLNDSDILLSDIQDFLLLIVTNAVHSPGNHNMQALCDILVVLRYLEQLEPGHMHTVTCLRTTQCAVLSHAVQLIQDKISSQQLPTSRIRFNASSFFNSVLSSGLDDMVDLQNSLVATSKSSSNSDSVNSITTTSSNYSMVQSLGRPNKVPRSEVNDRFKMIISKATEFFIHYDCTVPLSETEAVFARRLLSLLFSAMVAIVDRRSGARNTWSTIIWNCRDTVRSMTGQLMVWMLSPVQTNSVRMFVMQSLRNQLKAKDIISSLILSNSQVEQQFVLYLWELMYGADSITLIDVEKQVCEELKELLQAWSIYSPQSIGHEYDPWTDDLATMARSVYNQRTLWHKHQEPIVNRTIGRMEGLVKAVSEAALTATRVVVDAQNRERKAMMESLKQSLSDSIHAQIQWKVLTHQLTHERAVWHFPQSYPRSWQLDETEGPARVRKRLRRCHLNIDKRFLKTEVQDKLDNAVRPQPLSYLLGSESPSTAAVLIERLHMDEKIRHMALARIVTPSHEILGELLVGETSLYFVPNSDHSNIDNASSLDICSQAWQFEDVKEIHNRRFQLQERALEIFLLNGKTYLIAFESSTERDLFALELGQCELPHRVASDHLSDTVQLWREGHLTNWEYLTTLNKMAGRSYNDLMQYPVMPFVLADYTSSTLDLTDPKNYRNFKKPMAVQEKHNEQHYINYYNYLKQECTNALNFISINQEPYHYASHYSNSGTVLHFLVRLPPFTSMFINYQDNNFDLPDRTFHSVHTTWRLTSSESTTDVKELIPEFFFLPEFLANHEGYDFGTRQNGSKVDDVALPPWACGDARRFILVHRQALESDHVREHLPHWIDLVFGYKQTGKAAVESINVFHPATYYGFNPELVDKIEQDAFNTIIKTYGQTPRQLFRAAHPMTVQSLAPKTTNLSTVLGVKGISWGNYVGSPSDSSPSVTWQQQHRSPVSSLIPLLTNDVFGLAPATALLLAYSKEKTLSLVATGGTCVLGAALVSWGHSDGILRAKLKKEQPPYPAIRPPRCGGPITTCVSVPDCSQLWLGYASGKILVYRYKFKPTKGTLEFSPEPIELLAHNAPVLSLTLCRAYSVALSGAKDGSAVLWDINKISYVRSLPNISLPVNLTCVSEVSGDLATVGSDADSGGSTLRLHTINMCLVGSVTTRDHITSVCFSTAPEGTSINIIATGMSNGVIRLWSTWDLTAVGELPVPTSLDCPVIGLTYSHDSQHLYASTEDGGVVIWEGSAAKGASKTPKFLNLTTLI